MTDEYRKGSLSLTSTVAMGTGVMIGAGIFALTGQVAELAGTWFPLAFVIGAIISAFSAYSYIKVSSAYPPSGGVAMILHKAYGSTTITGAAALQMTFSMIINESLVAHTLAEAARPVMGQAGVWFTVVVAGLLAAFFDLSRIASLGAIFYLLMDIVIHWGVLRHLAPEVNAHKGILITDIILDVVVLLVFLTIKSTSDPLIVVIAAVGIGIIISLKFLFLRLRRGEEGITAPHSHS